MRTIDKPFGEIDIRNFLDSVKKELLETIEKRPKDYILGVDEDKYVNYLSQLFYIHPLAIDLSSKDTIPGKEERKSYANSWGYEEYYMTYYYHVYFNFSGDPRLFRVQPSCFRWNLSRVPSPIDFVDANRLMIQVQIHEKKPEIYKQEEEGVIDTTFCNMENVNAEINRFNTALPSFAKQTFESVRKKYQDDDAFLSAINAHTERTDVSKFVVPVVEKKMPIPIVSFDGQPNPMLKDNIYSSILDTIDSIYKGFEQLPNNYKDKDEEALRDSVLPMLNATYAMSGMVATGETFNKNGKTDICIKHTDNTNVFIAECKIWKGEKLFEDAINQLFDRYVTWHDTKVALIIFVKQNNFTEIIAKAKEAIKKHPYFLRTINADNPTRGSYIFRHSEDKQRQIKLELMLYHFNQK